MAALRSAPGGDRRLGWRGWAVGLAGAWALPAALGLVVMGLCFALSRLFGADLAAGAGPELLLAFYFAGAMLFFSPVLSWVGLILLAPSLWALMRLGLAGWLNVAGAGLMAGLVAGGVVSGIATEVTGMFGAAAALLLRSIFRAIDPEIFTAR
jgi:hypothetical protein